MKIEFATTNDQILKCRKAILEVRPRISPVEYLEKANLLLSEGAKMMYIDEGTDAPAIATFRINYYFFRGKNLYIDDLGTLAEHRGKGYAGWLLDFMIHHAK